MVSLEQGETMFVELEATTVALREGVQLASKVSREAMSPSDRSSAHRLMDMVPIPSPGDTFHTASERKAQLGYVIQPLQRGGSAILQTTESFGKWSPFSEQGPSRAPVTCSAGSAVSASLSPAVVTLSETAGTQQIVRGGPCHLSPDTNASLSSAWCGGCELQTGEGVVHTGGRAWRLPLGTPQRLGHTPRPPAARELRRLRAEGTLGDDGFLGSRSILSPVRGRAPTASNGNTQVAMMVRRSHRINAEEPQPQKVLQGTEYRYAPPGRRLSTEFESPQTESAGGLLPQPIRLPTLELLPQRQTPTNVGIGSNMEPATPSPSQPGAVDGSPCYNSGTDTQVPLSTTPTAQIASTPSTRITRAQSARKKEMANSSRREKLRKSISPNRKLSPTDERIRAELRNCARSARRSARLRAANTQVMF